jgi:CDP-glucose 4,6-dehydratase
MKSELKPVILGESVNEIRRQYLSASKARRLLGWRSIFSLDEGLKRTISWYKEFFQD